MPIPRTLVVLVALGLATLSPNSTATVDRPSWTVGDSWTYATNTTITPGLNLTGMATSAFAAIQPAESAGTTVNAYRVVISGAGQALGVVVTNGGNVSVRGTWTLVGEELIEPVGFHPIYSLLDISVNGTYQYGIVLPFSLRVQNTTTFQITQDQWQYPFSVGASGVLDGVANFTTDFYAPNGTSSREQGAASWTFSFTMAAPMSITTLAGTFTTYPVLERLPDGSSQRTYFAPAVGNDVRTESFAPDGNLTAVTSLVSYRYQALEPTAFLGLTALEWGIVFGAAVVLLLGVVAYRLRRKRRRTPPQGGREGSEPTSGPRGP